MTSTNKQDLSQDQAHTKIPDEDYLLISAKELNKVFKKRCISKEMQKEIKKKRRKHKNRVYTNNYREKSLCKEKTMLEENEKIKESVIRKQLDIVEIKKAQQELKEREQALDRDIENLKKEHEQYEQDCLVSKIAFSCEL